MTALDPRGERGFTLVELLVATMLGIIVSTATLAIVIASVHLSSNFGDRVDATQQGRAAITRIVQELDSSCVAATVPPILATSDANDLWFYSSFGTANPDAPTILPNEVEISYTSGSLVMYIYANSGSGDTPATWTFPSSGSPTSTFVLLPHAEPDNSAPIFQYFGYGSGGALSTTPYAIGTGTLGSTNAASTAEVQINFTAEPTDAWTAQGRPASFSDDAVLRLSPASSSASNLPCS